MTFADLLAGDSVFVDANTFTYHFQPHPVLGPPCSNLLQRIENQELSGCTSTHVLSEFAHRLMTIEASVLFVWPFTGIAYRLRKNPAQVQKLSAYWKAVDAVLNSRMQVLTIAPVVVQAAATVSRQTGLLCNDALIVAVMQQHGLTKLASSDSDFDGVPGLVRYAPE
jgi:predicted nucleic acid-binding protein